MRKREVRKYGAQYHVTEVYSPPRVTAMAERMGMIPGWGYINLGFSMTHDLCNMHLHC